MIVHALHSPLSFRATIGPASLVHPALPRSCHVLSVVSTVRSLSPSRLARFRRRSPVCTPQVRFPNSLRAAFSNSNELPLLKPASVTRTFSLALCRSLVLEIADQRSHYSRFGCVFKNRPAALGRRSVVSIGPRKMQAFAPVPEAVAGQELHGSLPENRVLTAFRTSRHTSGTAEIAITHESIRMGRTSLFRILAANPVSKTAACKSSEQRIVSATLPVNRSLQNGRVLLLNPSARSSCENTTVANARVLAISIDELRRVK